MNEILLILIVFMAGIVAFFFCFIWYMQFCLELMIKRKHEWLDFILATSYAPEQWSKPFTYKVTKLRQKNVSQEQIDRVRKRAQISCLRQLNKLTNYVQVATLIQDEADRIQITKSLMIFGEQLQRGEKIFYD